MFIIKDAYSKNLLDRKSEDYYPDALCHAAGKILGELDLPEARFFLPKLPDKDDYEI